MRIRLEANNPQPDTSRPPWWIHPAALTAVWWSALVYGSLLPWRFDLTRMGNPSEGWGNTLIDLLATPRWLPQETGFSSLGVSHWASDLALNIALYLPLGIVLRFAVRPIDRKPWVQVMAAIFAVLGTSWLLECAQGLLPDRVASLNDIVANVGAGALGVLIAKPLVAGLRRVVFGLYRRNAHRLWIARDWLVAQRQRPAMLFGMVAINALLLWAWVGASGIAGEGWRLPFAGHFERSYDVAAWWVGRSLLVYCLIGALLSLMLVRDGARRGLGAVVLLSAGLAAVAQIVTAATGEAALDVTEPLLATSAIGLLFVTVFLLMHAVRCSCRRKRKMPVEHDRRQRAHDYA